MSACADSVPVEDCCSAFYEQDWVRLLADNRFHPGGAELTRRTVSSLNLPPGGRVLDLGCGTGTSASLLAHEFGFEVTGIDLSAANVARARERHARFARGHIGCGTAWFQQADAQYLPFAADSFDGVLAECALSLFADPARALAEVRRVLRPEGRFALTDMAVGGPLPGELLAAAGSWACLHNARSRSGWEALFEGEGLQVQRSVDESGGLITLLRQTKRRLLVLGAGALLAEKLPEDVDFATVNHWLSRVGHEIDQGHIRYVRFLLR